MAYYDYTHADLQPQAWTVVMSAIGGAVLVVSAFLFIYILATARRTGAQAAPFTFSLPVHGPVRAPAALNSFAIWVALMIALTVVNYGFPIAQLAMLEGTSVPAVRVGER
jgi:cytochrome c oxidase subunit 1